MSERGSAHSSFAFSIRRAAASSALAMAALASAACAATEEPPPILLIYGEFVAEGGQEAYSRIEEDAARICANLNCPNAHFAIESVDEPTEVLWLTPFASQADIDRVTAAYEANDALMDAINDINARKQGLISEPSTTIAHRRLDVSSGSGWRFAGARFFVVTRAGAPVDVEGAAFDDAEGAHYVFAPVRTQSEAERLAAALGPDARVFALRPTWGMPAQDWIAADRAFWAVNPAAGGE